MTYTRYKEHIAEYEEATNKYLEGLAMDDNISMLDFRCKFMLMEIKESNFKNQLRKAYERSKTKDN
jgi:hypothetical protein